MRLLRVLSLAVLFAFSVTARAQVADFYATFAFDHLGTSAVTTSHAIGITDYYTPASTSYNAFGVTVGGTINFIDNHTQQFGVDLRETIAPASKSGAFVSLAGLRYSVFARKSRIRPYVEIAGGGIIERSNYTDTNILVNGPITLKTIDPSPGFTGHGAFEGLVGVDTKIGSTLSFRAEFGGGHVGGSFDGDGPGGGALVTFNTGVVFHFD